ncbi:MAG: heme o synthase [Planctomycetota bacterium]
MNIRTLTAPQTRALVADYVALTKPRLSLFVLLVVALAGWLASRGPVDLAVIVCAVVGTGLVAGGANALNMVWERKYDALMRRTDNRPVASGRLTPRDATMFGLFSGAAGLLLLALGCNPLAAAIGLLNLLLYVLVYTPLKRRTTLNTHIGAIPGALPALIGWTAVAGRPEPGAWMLFWLVFVWQIPHFLSIAWIYRDDYARGGFRMLSTVDPDGSVTGRQAVLGALALIPVSLLPALHGTAAPGYIPGAVLCGLWFLWRAIGFALRRDPNTARLLMRASLLYLPCVLALLVIFRVA